MARKLTEAALRVALGGLTKRQFNSLMYSSKLMPSGTGAQGYEFDSDDVVDSLGEFFGEDLSDFHSSNSNTPDPAGEAIVDAWQGTQSGSLDFDDEDA